MTVLKTPTVDSVALVLRHREEVLRAAKKMSGRATSKQIGCVVSQLNRITKQMTRTARLKRLSAMQQLVGFVSCELDHRAKEKLERRRMLRKSSNFSLRVRLPWVGCFAAQHGLDRSSFEQSLRQGSSALHRHLSDSAFWWVRQHAQMSATSECGSFSEQHSHSGFDGGDGFEDGAGPVGGVLNSKERNEYLTSFMTNFLPFRGASSQQHVMSQPERQQADSIDLTS
eukprot:TRINITY_DN30901_c0_g1_i1.p1 TRINITY_DN30901_c0_g1~~TRINITY_DN30901_c0_g1_i1.p1  ORF type:complete len:267 (-),score=21.25 TRINITY_DN30901_c0_g1_i1:215-895(-)